MARLRRGAAAYVPSSEWSQWEQYRDRLAEYDTTGTLEFTGGVLAIQQGHRSTTSRTSIGEVDLEVFDVLDASDIDSCTINLGSAYASFEVTVEFTPYACTINFKSEWVPDELKPATSIDEVEDVLRSAAAPWEQPVVDAGARPFRVFIGHGGDHQWRTLKDALRDTFNFDIESFERETRTGNVISEILPAMATASTAAVLVLTKADEMADGKWRGRQNVVHEIGYMQGVLGWRNTIVVVEDGVELFSNLDGTQHIPFPAGKIGAATADVVAALNSLKARPYGICP